MVFLEQIFPGQRVGFAPEDKTPSWHCQFKTIFQREERAGKRGELDSGSTVSVLPKLTRVDTWLPAGGAVGVVVEP